MHRVKHRTRRNQPRHRPSTRPPAHFPSGARRPRGLPRALRAQWRDARVLFQESRRSLTIFVGLVIVGALIFHIFYEYPGTGQHPRFGQAVHATFALIFFETLLPFPRQWYLQILFFIIPILGLAAVADGVLRFGTALLNKQVRGRKWQVAMASTYKDHVIVCGMGKVGYRVTRELIKFGREVVGIEIDPQGRFVEKAKSLGISLIIANARRSENLIKAGVKRADAVIPCTDDELTNLDIALDCREINPDAKVVMRLFDADLARRVEKGFGIHTAFSTSALAAPIFAAAAMRADVKYSFYVGDTLLSLSQVAVSPSSGLIGWTLETLEAELDLSVVFYQGEDMAAFHPNPEWQLSPGDEILVLAALDTLKRLNGFNQG